MKHKIPSFFTVALIGVFSLMLSNIYYLVINQIGGVTGRFSIGILGFSVSFLFWAVVNKTYIPPEYDEKNDRSISIPSVILTFPIIVIFGYIAISSKNIDVIACQLIYIVSLGYSLYHSFKNIVNKYNNSFKKEIIPFNVVICIMGYLTALSECVNFFTNDETLVIVSFVIKVLFAISCAILIPLLKRGLKPWEL